MDLLKSHRSIRKYKAMTIPDDVLEEILECGIRASNTGNMQLYSVVVTREQERKEALALLHFNQPMVKEAPVLLTVCFDLNRFTQWCTIKETSTDFSNLLWILTGTIDAAIFAQNICVAAENNGLGICYLGTALYNAPEIVQVLNLPKGVIPITALTIGYPDTVPELTDRLPFEAVVHYEEYTDYPEEKIAEIYQVKENLPSSRDFVSQNGKDNLAQVYAEVRYKTSDNRYFSEKLRQMLIAQGFVL
jgi:nitroreductase